MQVLVVSAAESVVTELRRLSGSELTIIGVDDEMSVELLTAFDDGAKRARGREKVTQVGFGLIDMGHPRAHEIVETLSASGIPWFSLIREISQSPTPGCLGVLGRDGRPLDVSCENIIGWLKYLRGLWRGVVSSNRVLLMEDTRPFALPLRDALEDVGFDVRYASTVSEARSVLEGDEEFGFVLSDGDLGTGYEDTDELLRPYAERIPVMRMTGSISRFMSSRQPVTGAGIWPKPLPCGTAELAEGLRGLMKWLNEPLREG